MRGGERIAVFRDTACKGCEHYKALGYYGACLHADGPTHKVLERRFADDRKYPDGCPIDPFPKQIRVRPKKKRGAKGGRPTTDEPAERRPKKTSDGW